MPLPALTASARDCCIPLLGHSRKAVVQVRAQYGGARGGRGAPSGRDSGLILGPGMGSPGGRGAGRLIVPGQGSSGGVGRPQRLYVPEEEAGLASRLAEGDGSPAPHVDGQVYNRFRPPPGFMDTETPDTSNMKGDPQELLNRLRTRAGSWHDLGKIIPVLHNEGFDSTVIDEMTGINPAQQNLLAVASTVYDSLKQSQRLPPAVLNHFEYNGEHLLYPFRFLAAERRVAAAEYIYASSLDRGACEVLARAMKEYERRPEERDGFSDSPADCLAFKYLRDAIECRRLDDMVEKVQLGLEVAETDGARARLHALIKREEEEQSQEQSAVLTILRLSPDELGYRPVAQISPLGQATLLELQFSGRCTQEGPFGSFTMVGEGLEGARWVALPQWKALSLARHPVALPVADCSLAEDIVAASRVKTEEERRRLVGPGLLVVDKHVEGEPLPDKYYLVEGPGNGYLMLKEGKALRGAEPYAEVLFLCRPPIREQIVPTADGLMQL